MALGDLQRELSDSTALIGWLEGSDQSWGWVVRREGDVRWVELPRGRAAQSEISSLRGALAASPGVFEDSPNELCRAVFEGRLAPLRKHLEGVTDLVVVPSGSMLGIPIEALLDSSGQQLVDRFSISYVPSGSVLRSLIRRGEGRAGNESPRALLVGDPTYDSEHPKHDEPLADEGKLVAVVRSVDPSLRRGALSGNSGELRKLPRLTGTRREVESLRSVLVSPDVLLGSDASEEAIVGLQDSGDLGRYDVVHFAVHGLIDDERPWNSSLVFSQIGLPDPVRAASRGERIYDGRITAREIVREWSLTADIVTLSACDTGLGRPVGGEGYVGLAHALLQVGTQSVVVGLWAVDDRATSLLMSKFYEVLFASGDRKPSRSEALSEAKRWLRNRESRGGHREYEHPYYWAGFVLVGSP